MTRSGPGSAPNRAGDIDRSEGGFAVADHGEVGVGQPQPFGEGIAVAHHHEGEVVGQTGCRTADRSG